MERESSTVIEEVRAPNVAEVPWPKEQTVSSSSGDSSDSRHDSATNTQEEGSEAMDSSESSRSYIFRPSTVTVSRFQKMLSLHYFTGGDVQDPRKEVIQESADDEVVVFEEFFTAEIRMPP
jgi:hypothetical protein